MAALQIPHFWPLLRDLAAGRDRRLPDFHLSLHHPKTRRPPGRALPKVQCWDLQTRFTPVFASEGPSHGPWAPHLPYIVLKSRTLGRFCRISRTGALQILHFSPILRDLTGGRRSQGYGMGWRWREKAHTFSRPHPQGPRSALPVAVNPQKHSYLHTNPLHFLRRGLYCKRLWNREFVVTGGGAGLLGRAEASLALLPACTVIPRRDEGTCPRNGCRSPPCTLHPS